MVKGPKHPKNSKGAAGWRSGNHLPNRAGALARARAIRPGKKRLLGFRVCASIRGSSCFSLYRGFMEVVKVCRLSKSLAVFNGSTVLQGLCIWL